MFRSIALPMRLECRVQGPTPASLTWGGDLKHWLLHFHMLQEDLDARRARRPAPWEPRPAVSQRLDARKARGAHRACIQGRTAQSLQTRLSAQVATGSPAHSAGHAPSQPRPTLPEARGAAGRAAEPRHPEAEAGPRRGGSRAGLSVAPLRKP